MKALQAAVLGAALGLGEVRAQALDLAHQLAMVAIERARDGLAPFGGGVARGCGVAALVLVSGCVHGARG